MVGFSIHGGETLTMYRGINRITSSDRITMSGQKTISYKNYLAGLGLFILATNAADEAEKLEEALCQHIGVPIGGHISDSVWCDNRRGDFKKILRYAGIEVEEEEEQKVPFGD